MCFPSPGREWSDWSSELRIPGDELKWKFISDGSVNGWGWRFTVYPIMPAAGKLEFADWLWVVNSSFSSALCCVGVSAVREPALRFYLIWEVTVLLVTGLKVSDLQGKHQ